MLDQLKLRSLLRFIAANPIPVVNMFAPQRAIVRADDVVVLDDFLLVVWLRRGNAPGGEYL
jgi:hypothetical protein